jgi:hypothetical protein
VALLAYRKWGWLPILLIPLFAWDLAGWLITHRPGPWWRWLHDAWPWSSQSAYGRGNPLVFIAAMPIVVTPLALPALLIGLAGSLSAGSRAQSMHLRVCRFCTALIPLFILAAHSLLRWTGMMGSLGEPRYMLTAAPFWAVLCARGWEWASARFDWKHPVAWAGIASLVPVLVNFACPAVPIHLSGEWAAARRFAGWYQSPQAREVRRDYPNVIASHPGIFYFLKEDPNGDARRGGFTPGLIGAPPPGTIMVWDPIYGLHNASIDDTATLESIRSAGWEPQPALGAMLTARDPRHPWHVFLSPRPAPPRQSAPREATPRRQTSPPPG